MKKLSIEEQYTKLEGRIIESESRCTFLHDAYEKAKNRADKAHVKTILNMEFAYIHKLKTEQFDITKKMS